MRLQHKELLHCIINALNEFNVETEGVEDFISSFLTRQKVSILVQLFKVFSYFLSNFDPYQLKDVVYEIQVC